MPLVYLDIELQGLGYHKCDSFQAHPRRILWMRRLELLLNVRMKQCNMYVLAGNCAFHIGDCDCDTDAPPSG
jgi:hypothetical protein